MTTTEPGWYAEPGNPGMTRYWDGNQWTPETRQNFGGEVASRNGAVSAGGLIVLAIGLAGVVVAFAALTWLQLDFGGADKVKFSFGDLGDDDTLPGFAAAYFAWIGWVVLAATSALALAACLPTSSRDTFRYLGFAAGVAGVAATMGALVAIEHRANVSASDFISACGPGPWVAMIAFLVIGLAAMMGQLGQG